MEPNLLWLVAFPALLAAAAMLATRPWRRGRDLGGWGAAIAIAGGFAIAFYNLFGGVPPFPPASAQQWIFFLIVPVVVVAAAMGFARSKWLAIGGSILVLAVAPWLMLRNLPFDTARLRWTWIVGASVAMVAWWAGMETLARRSRGGTLPLLLAGVMGIAGLAIISGRIATLGQATGSIAVPLVVVALAATWARGVSLARGGILAVAVFLLGLLIVAHLTSSEPVSLRDMALLALAPLAAWAGELPKLGKPDSWKRVAVRTVAVFLVLALPAVNAVKGLAETLQEQTDSYSY